MGRRAKYDYTDSEFLLEIEGLARDGWDDKQIADKYHLEPTYFSRLKDQYPQLSQALKRGRKPLNIIVENSLYKRAIGLKVKTTVRKWLQNPDGSTTDIEVVQETETELPPDTGAAMAWLKQRKPDQWNKQPIKIDHTSSDGSMTPAVNISPIEWVKTKDAEDKRKV